MQFRSRLAALLVMVAAATTLVGCSRTLDFRNAEVVTGKIYSHGANTPFSGKVTNLPLTAIPIGGLKPLLSILTSTTGDNAYQEYFLANVLGAVMGRAPGVVCDVDVKEGVLHGEAACNIGGAGFLKLAYQNGAPDGPIAILDPRRPGKVAAEGAFSNGALNGASKVYDSSTGKVLHTVGWKNGVADGVEEQHDKAGVLRFKARLVGGKYDGEATKYDEQGKVVVTTYFKAGVAERNVRAGLSELENCVEDWAAEHQVRMYGSAATPQDREEWKQACSRGQRWNSPKPPEVSAATGSPAQGGGCVDAWIAAYRKSEATTPSSRRTRSRSGKTGVSRARSRRRQPHFRHRYAFAAAVPSASLETPELSWWSATPGRRLRLPEDLHRQARP